MNAMGKTVEFNYKKEFQLKYKNDIIINVSKIGFRNIHLNWDYKLTKVCLLNYSRTFSDVLQHQIRFRTMTTLPKEM